MGRTVLINAGPWLPVPPAGYGGIEHVVACLVPELRRRGHRVVLATVGESTIEADEKLWVFPRGQFHQLAAPYGQVMGAVHAHMQRVLDRLDQLHAGPTIDLVHDHLEVVGPSMLAVAPPRRSRHWPAALR